MTKKDNQKKIDFEIIEVQSDKPISFQYTSRDEQTIITYKGTLISEGGLGAAYLVREEKISGLDNTTISPLVLKVLSKPITDERKELFVQNAEDAFQKRFILKTYVGIQGRGTVKMTDVAEEYPVLLMDYGGVDLEKARANFEKIEKNVVAAFQYKTLLTLISGLRETWSKNIFHEDLSPNNILCGFDLEEKDTSVLEKKIIEGHVCLTDRSYNELTSEYSISASVAQNFKFKMYFFSGAELATPQDRDLYSFFANSAWLFSGNRGETPEAHAVRMYGIATKLSSDGRTTFFDTPEKNSIEEVLTRIVNKIRERVLEGNYFFMENKVDDNGERCIVRRPIDQFRAAWELKVIDDADTIEQLCETDESSYKNVVNHGSTKFLNANEQKEMRSLLGSYLHKSAKIIRKKYDHNVENQTPLLNKISSLGKEKVEIENKRTASDTRIKVVRQNLKDLTNAMLLDSDSGDKVISQLEKLQEFGNKLKMHESEKIDFTKKIDELTQEIERKDEESRQYAVDMQKRAKEMILEKGVSVFDGVEYESLKNDILSLLNEII